ncbi:MAG: penicillin-binding transpeptidase domain-containing protein [Lachnospiraceae bacterium]|nr:penicillin-binding transpeptidase domain-containing protein [Lachnospiraceae bacterium]
MRFTRDQEEEMQEQIGEDIRDILDGKSVRSSNRQYSGRKAVRSSGGHDPEGPDNRESFPEMREGATRNPRRNRGNTGRDGDKRGLLKKQTRVPFLFVSYAFVAIFVALIVYIGYFNVRLRDDILNSPYNRRQNDNAVYVVRGEILAKDGTVLAETELDDDGVERRFYPEENKYAHVVGFTANGKSGLESLLNYDLLAAHNNILDRVINEFQGEKNPGDNVVTTLDTELQDVAYEALGDWDGAAVVLEPDTGNVLAMVSKPDFDPNTIAEEWEELVADDSNSQLVNRATQGKYPPGSTFKIVTALAYYRAEGNIEDFFYDCDGSFTVDDNNTVHCFNSYAHGEEDLTEAFANSCNSAFSEIGLEVGARALGDTAEDLLFQEKLPCDIAYSRSAFTLSSGAGDASVVQTAFGQGDTLVSPYHLALIASAIANDGVLMKTNFVDHIESDTGAVVKETKPSQYKTLMTEDEADVLTELMKAVVDEGTASALQGLDYSVACKTGSAEFEMSDGELGTHSWFVGFSDPDDPDIVVAVITENGGTGSSTSLPIAKQIFDAYYD